VIRPKVESLHTTAGNSPATQACSPWWHGLRL